MSEVMLLKLYVFGMTPTAKRAITNLKKICGELGDAYHYDIQVVDIREHPKLAEDERILATPTVIRHLPPPVRRLIGDLSDKEQVLIGLDLVRS